MTDINGKKQSTVGFLMKNTEKCSKEICLMAYILHTTDNLKKLCVEIAQFCRAVYASTQNEAERKIYFDMLEKLNKK